MSNQTHYLISLDKDYVNLPEVLVDGAIMVQPCGPRSVADLRQQNG